MLSSVVLFSTLVVSALGQNTSAAYTFPAGFNIGLVKPDELNSWCQGQRNQCPAICKTGTRQNTCDPKTLQFSCICADGTSADVSPYLQTVPFYVCEANYGQCIDAHPNDATGQEACKKATKCGSKNATALASSSSSSSASVASHTMTVSTTSDSDKSVSSASTAASASATTSNAAAPLAGLLEKGSTGVFASLMFLAMRLVL